ncbi:MAG: hypothetical protein IJI33_00955 [Solobacterium sp.]|nr:hypothetical protein [Solobacterium sp.]MBR0213843.1 hypothetical protein [Solobacterium sp.]
MARFDVTFSSYSLFRDVEITVIVPSMTIVDMMNANGAPVHHGAADPFPVVYLLHGFGNNRNGWLNYTNVQMYAEERHIAIVTISAENKAYLDLKADRFFQFVSEELPEFVTGMFPISKRPEDTYIAGLSMGGFGTLIHGLSNPEKYCAMGPLSAAPRLSTAFAETYGRGAGAAPENPADVRVVDALDAAKKNHELGRTFPKIYMACGKNDFLYEENVKTRDALKELGIDVTWEELDGYAHEWRFWNLEIERFLDWLPRTDAYADMPKTGV